MTSEEMSAAAASDCATLAIWMASSRVGVMTSACVTAACGLIFSMIGSRKASVLPVPVCALTMQSLPARTSGMAFSCTGVASLMP